MHTSSIRSHDGGRPRPGGTNPDDAVALDGTSAPAPDLPPDVLRALVAMGTELQAEEIDLDRVLRLATRNAARLLSTDLAWLSLHDPVTHSMHVAVSHGVENPDFDAMTVAHGEGLGGAALAHGGAFVVDDYAGWAAPGPVREAMLSEGVVSVVCAPMLRGETVVGVLYAANRAATRFTRTDADVVTALAAQVSVAIDNGRLYSNLLDKTRTLEETFEIHRALGEAAVSGIGLDRVVRVLGRLTGRHLVLEQQVVTPFALHSNPPEGDPGVAVAVVPVRRHDVELGRIRVLGDRPLSELERNTLSHGATVLALELMRHEAALDVEWRLRGDLLDQLIEAGDDRSAELPARAARYGIDLDAPAAVVVVEALDLDSVAVRALVRRAVTAPDSGVHRETVLTGLLGGRGVVALCGDAHDDARFVRTLVRLAGSAVLRIGSGRGPSGVAAGYREAQACCRLARQSGGATTRVVDAADLGPLRFMLNSPDVAHARAYVREQLGAVAAHEDAGGARLLTTLRAFVDEDGHHRRIADSCHVHTSTVKYRLGRITELIGRPLQAWETRFEIALAFRLADLLQISPETGSPNESHSYATIER